jgi:hypothetical protein
MPVFGVRWVLGSVQPTTGAEGGVAAGTAGGPAAGTAGGGAVGVAGGPAAGTAGGGAVGVAGTAGGGAVGVAGGAAAGAARRDATPFQRGARFGAAAGFAEVGAADVCAAGGRSAESSAQGMSALRGTTSSPGAGALPTTAEHTAHFVSSGDTGLPHAWHVAVVTHEILAPSCGSAQRM